MAVLSVVGIYQFRRAERLALAVENQYVHSFHELTDYVRDVDVLLKKSMLVSNPRQLSALSSNIFMQTAAAKANLAQLPVADLDLAGTSKFLSQAGDYASYLSAKVIDSGSISEEDYKNLEALSGYCETVSSHLEGLQTQLYERRLSIDTVTGITAHAEEENAPSFGSGMENIEKEFQDYPALIYDGPFSEHIETAEPQMLKNRLPITQEEALERAQSFLGDERGRGLVFSDEGGGRMETFAFSAREKERDISISITRQGGLVYYFLEHREVEAETLSVEEAIGKAADFLQAHGFSEMASSYYETSDGVATINFAAMQEGVILYSDLVKVKVALDNGEIIGLEAGGYLMSHRARELETPVLDETAARERVNSHLAITSVRPALIPLDSMREVLCYECKGSFHNQNFLIYINAVTGKEEKILMLIESEEGILTI